MRETAIALHYELAHYTQARRTNCTSISGGVNLLVLVIKRGRLTDTIQKNYVLFHHGFCDSKVPIVIVVTRCEDVEPTMDKWWTENEQSFRQAGMTFDGHACVCAFKGKKMYDGYRNEALFEQSAQVIKQLVVRRCKAKGWKSVCYFQSLVKLEGSEFPETLPM